MPTSKQWKKIAKKEVEARKVKITLPLSLLRAKIIVKAVEAWSMKRHDELKLGDKKSADIILEASLLAAELRARIEK